MTTISRLSPTSFRSTLAALPPTAAAKTQQTALDTFAATATSDIENQDAWEPVHPAHTNAPGHRSADAYDTVIDQFHVETNPRYAPRDGNTYCNIFAWDVITAMGVQLPHWVYPDGSPAPANSGAQGGYELDANAENQWLNQHGSQYGWKKVSAADAQKYANQGLPVVASEHVDPIGHIGVVRPGDNTSMGPHLAQAGGTNDNDGHVYQYFDSDQVEFWVNTSGGAGTTQPSKPKDSATAQVPQSDLTLGDTGGDVTKLQKAMVKLGYLKASDLSGGTGTFGPKTLAAVKAFQTKAGILPAYGNYGPLTRAALTKAIAALEPKAVAPDAPLKRGDKGPKVHQLKVALYRLGWISKDMLTQHPDEYGSGTEAAVRRFQLAYGLQPSGKYGSGTEAKLKAALDALKKSQATAKPPSSGGGASAQKIDGVLAGSPMAGQGANIAAMAKQYNVPPELALAMINHEDEFMRTGRAAGNNNPGNLRFVGQPGAVDNDGFAQWPTVKQGLDAFFKLLSTTYRTFIDHKDWAGLVHLYAPSSDGNDEQDYVNAITSGMATYKAEIY